MEIVRDVFVLENVVLVASYENGSVFVYETVINIKTIGIDFKIYDIDIVGFLYVRFSHVEKTIIVLCHDFLITFAVCKLQNIVRYDVHIVVMFSFHVGMITRCRKCFLDFGQEF